MKYLKGTSRPEERNSGTTVAPAITWAGLSNSVVNGGKPHLQNKRINKV